MKLLGSVAPDFNCQALVNGEIKQLVSLADFAGKYKILLFYPLDFTFVCPTELHAFQDKYHEFKQRNAVVLGISVDSVYCHQAWLEQPKSEGGIQGIEFPLLSDITKTIARDYNVLNEAKGIAYRAIFLLDKSNIIQVIQVNNLNLGRNIEEVLRLLDALIFTEQHGEVCPANWTVGQEGMQETKESVQEYFAKK
jgi:peroxiredoxin (alkyl hydroperoxide reductase subunit C)